MRTLIGAGWAIHHLTDRTVELRKESADYRRLTGADGFVLVRGEPGMPRHALIDHATEKALALDDELARRIAEEAVPAAGALHQYGQQLRRLAPAFSTGEEPAYIGRQRA